MNKKEERELRRSWGMVIAGTLLAFLVSIFASSVFELYIHGFSWKVFSLLIGFGFGIFFVTNFFSYTIDNINEPETRFLFSVWRYIKSWFKNKS